LKKSSREAAKQGARKAEQKLLSGYGKIESKTPAAQSDKAQSARDDDDEKGLPA